MTHLCLSPKEVVTNKSKKKRRIQKWKSHWNEWYKCKKSLQDPIYRTSIPWEIFWGSPYCHIRTWIQVPRLHNLGLIPLTTGRTEWLQHGATFGIDVKAHMCRNLRCCEAKLWDSSIGKDEVPHPWGRLHISRWTTLPDVMFYNVYIVSICTNIITLLSHKFLGI